MNQPLSHPVWVCGLKHLIFDYEFSTDLSHPVWVCGLKQNITDVTAAGNKVTPCMGVWIETRVFS